MEGDWTGTGTEDGESLGESFENVSAPSSLSPPPPIALPHRLAPAVETKQPSLLLPPPAHLPKLP